MADKKVLTRTNGTKTADPKLTRRSVVSFPSYRENSKPINSFILNIASAADEVLPWGMDIKGRDWQLRQFWPTESFLASAVYSTAIRNASFDWKIVPADPKNEPRPRTQRAVTTMLNNADRGRGWISLLTKTYIDVYSQDNGGFWEIIRADKRPNAPVVNIAHLDAWRCTRTGDPSVPVLYEDREGKIHELMWYQVMTIEEFPSPIETMNGAQVCAVSRALRAAQVIRDIAVYKHEKVSGRFSQAIHLVGGIPQTELEDVIAWHQEQQDTAGLTRYTPPIIMSGVDPTNPVSHIQIDLASLPDSFDENTTYTWYVAQLAIAFGVDYQEFAPLPAGNLGAGQQSEILHMKTRGKGPALVMRLMEHKLNNSGILPASVKFEFTVKDLRAENEEAQAAFNRSKDRSLRIRSQELDVEAARELAVLDGDLPEHLSEDIARRDEERKREQEDQQQDPSKPATALNRDDFGPEQVQSGSDPQDFKALEMDHQRVLLDLIQQGVLPSNVSPVTLTDEELNERRQQIGT